MLGWAGLLGPGCALAVSMNGWMLHGFGYLPKAAQREVPVGGACLALTVPKLCKTSAQLHLCNVLDIPTFVSALHDSTEAYPQLATLNASTAAPPLTAWPDRQCCTL